MDYDVVEARYVRDYVIWLRFRDGTAGDVDLGPELRGEVFEPLRDVDYFRTFTVDPQFRTLVWPNDVDLAPEFLHDAARANSAPPPPVRGSATPGIVLMTEIDESRHTVDRMPVVSRFLGIVISMYHKEHGIPHFHAVYGEHRISFEIESGVVHGDFPPRALCHVREWAALHRAALLENWESARQKKRIDPIPPLE